MRVRSSAVDGLQLLLSSRALRLKCFPRFIKLPRCLRRSPEWLISFAASCRQNLWSKHPESAPGGSRRVMCSLSLVSHCLGQSTIITSLWSPWFSYTLASLKQLHITRAECWMVSDGAINVPRVPLIRGMEIANIPAVLAALYPFSKCPWETMWSLETGVRPFWKNPRYGCAHEVRPSVVLDHKQTAKLSRR